MRVLSSPRVFTRTTLCVAASVVAVISCSSPTDTPPAVTAVAVTPGNISIHGVGTEAQAQAALTPDNTGASISWRSANNSVATVSGSGAAATVKAVAGGTTQIYAKAGSVEQSASVTVTPIARSISTQPTSASVGVGETVQINATLVRDAGVPATLAWSSDATGIASVSQDGVVTGVSVGTANVSVASTAFPDVKTILVVTVGLPSVTVAIQPGANELITGATRQLVASVTAAPAVPTTVTWSSSASGVAAVNNTGLVTAAAPGNATITATSTANPAATATVQLSVRSPRVTALDMTLAASVAAGQTAQAVVAVTAESGANTVLDYASTNTNVATVSATGLVTALAAGNTTISATSKTTPPVTTSKQITVTPPLFAMQWTGAFEAMIGAPDLQGNFRAPVILPDSTVILVGDGGVIVERSKAGVWTRRNSGTTQDLQAVTVAGDTAWAAGNNGVILRRSRTTGWHLEPSGTNTNLVSIAMRSNGSGIVGGNQTAIMLERSGGVWSQITAPIPVTQESPKVGVSEGGGRYVLYTNQLQGNPIFFRWNGASWDGFVRPSSQERYSFMLVLDDNDVLLAGQLTGNLSFINRWTNGAWVREFTDPFPSEIGRNFSGLFRCVDGTIMTGLNYEGMLVRNGTTWAIDGLPEAVLRSQRPFACITKNFHVHSAGSWVFRVDGSVVTTEILREDLSRVGWAGGQIAIAAASAASAALRFNGNTWSAHVLPTFKGFALLGEPGLGVFPDGPDVIISSRFIGTWNGSAYAWAGPPLPATGVWGVSANDVWAAGGTAGIAGVTGVMRRTGGTWSSVPTGVIGNDGWGQLWGSAADAVFVVGRQGEIGRWDGATFTRDAFTPSNVTALDLAVFSKTSAIAVTPNQLLRWNGIAWTLFTIPGRGTATITAIAGSSENEFFIFDTLGDMYGCSLTQCTLIRRWPAVVRRVRVIGNVGLGVGDDGFVIRGSVTGASVSRSVRR